MVIREYWFADRDCPNYKRKNLCSSFFIWFQKLRVLTFWSQMGEMSIGHAMWRRYKEIGWNTEPVNFEPCHTHQRKWSTCHPLNEPHGYRNEREKKKKKAASQVYGTIFIAVYVIYNWRYDNLETEGCFSYWSSERDGGKKKKIEKIIDYYFCRISNLMPRR